MTKLTQSQKRKVKHINKIFEAITSIAKYDVDYAENMRVEQINKYLLAVSEGTLEMDARFIDIHVSKIIEAIKKRDAKQGVTNER